MDQLITCPVCEGNACYEQQIDETTKTYLCFGCGMSTSSLMKEGSNLVYQTREASPELYKDLSFTDNNKLVWFPATISIPEKGMVFVDGTDKDNWVWKAAKAILISEEERKNYPSDQTFKMDMKNAKEFPKRDFMNALDYIEFYSL